MINTLNESSLHRSLKLLYALEKGCTTEVNIDGKIYDVVDALGNITEIQTKNLSSLLVKTLGAIKSGRCVKIVYPVVRIKYIEVYDEKGVLLSKRKSPVRASIYSIFRELTGLYPVLLKKRFSLDVLEIAMSEIRMQSETPVQSPNGRRRFLKNWNKTDKKLETIFETHTFTKASDYLSLIPESCLPRFCTRDIASSLAENKDLPASAKAQANLMLWVLSHMKLIEAENDISRPRYYRIR
ncbi:hypothetical protein [Treponema sp. Marseille-Q4132]|uniref:hypothetical protein n=1 Tax=Treponema sp. Marseille-Q4132 TaxID=2766701 RepID=UPI001652FA27|nr:hypothetical protein [Treponema sp. Marseille-Q4132]QNL97671.1 hypothetical protein H9I35_02640 [Treponema sp. Marseille-Q4132]